METLWVFVATINGIIAPPAGVTAEEVNGFSFAQVSSTTQMHYDSEETCNTARDKLLVGQADMARGLQNVVIEVTKCEAVEFTVE